MVLASALSLIGDGFSNAFEMAYEVWWALVFGFAISAVVQAWVPRARIERSLSGSGIVPVGWAALLGDFCGEECRASFLAEPATFLGEAAHPAAHLH